VNLRIYINNAAYLLTQRTAFLSACMMACGLASAATGELPVAATPSVDAADASQSVPDQPTEQKQPDETATAGNTTEKYPLWEMNLAAYARYGPSYPASENSQTNIVPLPFPIYRGKILRVGDDAEKPISTRIFRRDNIKLDIDFGLNFPVESDEVDARVGMPDLDLVLEAGPQLELQFVESPRHGDMFLDLRLRGALSFDGLDPTWRGVVFGTQLKYVRPINLARKTEASIRLVPEWGSGDYMDFYYSVTPEFATPEREVFSASGGYLGTKLSFSLDQRLNDKLRILTGVRFGFYEGARNRKSPLFTDKTTTTFYFAFLWKFWESKRMVTAE
jgi:hypothetical protein